MDGAEEVHKKTIKISVLSGKGGTGKTTVALLLAMAFARKGKKSLYVDADVEEPNGAIFLKPDFKAEGALIEDYNEPVPVVNESICTYCGECAQACVFKAIVVVPQTKKWLFFEDLCHSCGVCWEICPEKGALSTREHKRGIIRFSPKTLVENLSFSDGILNVGEATGTTLIKNLIEKSSDLSDVEVTVIDSPPGTSCPVVQVIEASDVVLLTGEPTPFGLEDLKLAWETVENIRKTGTASPLVVASINKETGMFPEMEKFLKEYGIPIVLSLPYSEELAQKYSQENLVGAFELFRDRLSQAASEILKIAGAE